MKTEENEMVKLSESVSVRKGLSKTKQIEHLVLLIEHQNNQISELNALLEKLGLQ